MVYLVDWRISDPDVHPVAEALRRGELVVLPTDTCYGLACDAFNSEAVGRLRRTRGMLDETLLAVLVAGTDVVEALTAGLPEQAKALASAYWPGPVSMLLPARSSLDWDLGSPSTTVAIRVPDHEELLELLRLSGPLAVSQASQVAEPPPYSINAALDSLADGVDMAVDAGVLPNRSLSTFVDCRGHELVVLRPGPITASEILATAHSGNREARSGGGNPDLGEDEGRSPSSKSDDGGTLVDEQSSNESTGLEGGTG